MNSTATFRVTIERHHPNGAFIGSGTRVVQAADKDEAARVAVAEAVDFMKAKNAARKAEAARTGLALRLDSEDPEHYVVKSIHKAPQRRAA